jgi:hypothetical protein
MRVMKFGHRRNGAAIVHQLAKHGAEKEQRKKLRKEMCCAAHKDLGPIGEQRLRTKECSDEGGRWCEQRTLQPL